jgi:hypothetical protein
VPFGQGIEFPKKHEETDAAVLGCAWLQIQGRKLLKNIIVAHSRIFPVTQIISHTEVCSENGTTDPEPEDDIKLRCKELADYVEHCSGRIFYDLKVRLRTDVSFCTLSGVPNEVRTGSALKSAISQGLRGATGWNLQARLAVVRMLLAYDRAILLAQLGALSEVLHKWKPCFTSRLRHYK